MMPGAKPGPSSRMVTATTSSVHSVAISTLRLGEIDGVLDEIGEAVEDRRIAAADRLGAGALGGG